LDPVVRKHGHRPAATLPPDKAIELIQEIGKKRPAMANLTRKILHRVFKQGKIRPNPFDGIAAYKIGTHHTWTESELTAFEASWPLGTRQRLAYALLLFTGQPRWGCRENARRGRARGLYPRRAGEDRRRAVHPDPC